MLSHPHSLVRVRYAFAVLLACLVALTTLGSPAPASAEVAGPRVIAADGTVQPITAIDPSSRTAGLFALYTPEFGATTKTNQFGGEAIVRETGAPGAYEVVDVCTVFDGCPNAGNNAIPEDGFVLSASPGGTPDVRLFLRDHVEVGDVVQLLDLKVRSASTMIDATDPTPATNPPGVDPGTGQCYPGCRGAEQLIVYTPAFGERTGTNDFGYEVAVVDGIVVERGGNNRAIPAGGFVLSGHGSRGSWLSSNAVLGARVTIEGSSLTVTIDATTYVYGAQQALGASTDAIAAAETSCLDFPIKEAQGAANEAQALLEQSRAAIDAGDTDGAVELAEQAQDAAELAGYRTAESRPVEGRVMWVRPTETTPEAINNTLDQLQTAGINIVMVETVWQGYTIFPSDVAEAYGIEKQRPEMVGFDPLQVWIDGAHARGMELHPWVHTFYVGAESVGDAVGPVLTAHPEWAAVEREDVGEAGPQPSSREPGYFFIDPAIPEVREYVRSLFEEILTDYDVDGLHLDYIRYPVSEPWETAAFSYSDYARSAFEAEHGVDPYLLTPADALWATWTQWREAQVTTFVESVREMQRTVAPDVQLSAAVFPDPSDGLAKKFQNWADWVQKGYVDFLTGMSFGTSGASVARDTELMRESVGELSLLYTATYGPFRGSTPDVVLDQIQSVRDAGADGAALFAYNQLSARQLLALEEGVFRTEATVPHADLVSAAIEGTRYARRQAVGAAGACMPGRVIGQVVPDLAQAQGYLRRGDLNRAAESLATARADLAAASGVQPEFAQRLDRDLAMYGRWVERASLLD